MSGPNCKPAEEVMILSLTSTQTVPVAVHGYPLPCPSTGCMGWFISFVSNYWTCNKAIFTAGPAGPEPCLPSSMWASARQTTKPQAVLEQLKEDAEGALISSSIPSKGLRPNHDLDENLELGYSFYGSGEGHTKDRDSKSPNGQDHPKLEEWVIPFVYPFGTMKEICKSFSRFPEFETDKTDSHSEFRADITKNFQISCF
ncbi:hypothetical protein llap_2031 [Limosa lapponica baueri]|uniref:Uncharacterized protein n=1 Tax=Limosa lapponica baueri TaxID=1758121 RepID=A0A2I0UNL1_LIMLA|nr:hypothetical protein llap_2031 [Limosa lapponica baueri]